MYAKNKTFEVNPAITVPRQKATYFGRGQVCARSSAIDFFQSMEDPAVNAVTQS